MSAARKPRIPPQSSCQIASTMSAPTSRFLGTSVASIAFCITSSSGSR